MTGRIAVIFLAILASGMVFLGASPDIPVGGHYGNPTMAGVGGSRQGSIDTVTVIFRSGHDDGADHPRWAAAATIITPADSSMYSIITAERIHNNADSLTTHPSVSSAYLSMYSTNNSYLSNADIPNQRCGIHFGDLSAYIPAGATIDSAIICFRQYAASAVALDLSAAGDGWRVAVDTGHDAALTAVQAEDEWFRNIAWCKIDSTGVGDPGDKWFTGRRTASLASADDYHDYGWVSPLQAGVSYTGNEYIAIDVTREIQALADQNMLDQANIFWIFAHKEAGPPDTWRITLGSHANGSNDQPFLKIAYRTARHRGFWNGGTMAFVTTLDDNSIEQKAYVDTAEFYGSPVTFMVEGFHVGGGDLTGAEFGAFFADGHEIGHQGINAGNSAEPYATRYGNPWGLGHVLDADSLATMLSRTTMASLITGTAWTDIKTGAYTNGSESQLAHMEAKNRGLLGMRSAVTNITIGVAGGIPSRPLWGSDADSALALRTDRKRNLYSVLSMEKGRIVGDAELDAREAVREYAAHYYEAGQALMVLYIHKPAVDMSYAEYGWIMNELSLDDRFKFQTLGDALSIYRQRSQPVSPPTWTNDYADGVTLNDSLWWGIRQEYAYKGQDVTPLTVPENTVAYGWDSAVDIFWDDTAGDDGDFETYLLYRGTKSGELFPYVETGIVQGGYQDEAATNDSTYYYAVCSVDTNGNISAQSNEVSATPYIQFFGFTMGAWADADGEATNDMTVRFRAGSDGFTKKLWWEFGDAMPDTAEMYWSETADDTLSGVWGTGIASPVADPDSGGIDLSWTDGTGYDYILLQMSANGWNGPWVTVEDSILFGAELYNFDMEVGDVEPRRGELGFRIFGYAGTDTSSASYCNAIFYNQAKLIYTRWYATQDSVHVTASWQRSKLYKAVP